MEKRLAKEWEAARGTQQDEWDIVTLHSYEYVPDATEIQELLVSQAPPIRITPSRRSRPAVDYDQRVACIGDIHFPFHDEKKLELAETGLRALDVGYIALMGDNLDFANYSRFENRKEWGDSTQRGIDLYAEFLGRLRANHPEADIVWFEGNHDQRVEKRIREYNEDILGIKRAGEATEALSLDFLLRLDELGVRFIKGYPSAREVVEGKLELYHGDVTARGFAASKVIEQAFLSFTTGHTHNLGIVAKTFYVGEEKHTIYGAEAGTYADPNKTPSGKYAPNQVSRHNWHSGIIDWVIYEEEAIPAIHPITDSILIDGKRYKS